MKEDVFNGVGIEIEFGDPSDFLKIKETLTRIGVASKNENKLFQSCHILHKKGRYAIVHFKELFILDGKEETTIIDEEDYSRRNTIVRLLQDWKLLTLVGKKDLIKNAAPMSDIKVIPHSEKAKWTLVPKYNIGGKSNKP